MSKILVKLKGDINKIYGIKKSHIKLPVKLLI